MEKKYHTLTEAYASIYESSIYGEPDESDFDRETVETEPSGSLDVESEIIVPSSFIIDLIKFLDKEISVTDDEVEKGEHLQMRDKLEKLLLQ